MYKEILRQYCDRGAWFKQTQISISQARRGEARRIKNSVDDVNQEPRNTREMTHLNAGTKAIWIYSIALLSGKIIQVQEKNVSANNG